MAILTRSKVDAVLVPRPGVVRLTDGKLSDVTLGYLRGLFTAIIDRINGMLSLGSAAAGTWSGNIDGQFLEFSSPNDASLAIAIPHGLGRVPVGYVVVRTIGGAASVYDGGGGSWTDATLYLHSTGGLGTNIRILVF